MAALAVIVEFVAQRLTMSFMVSAKVVSTTAQQRSFRFLRRALTAMRKPVIAEALLAVHQRGTEKKP